MNNTPTDKEEKKGGALPPWMTGSARVGSGLGSGGSSTAGGGLAKFLGLLAGPKAIVAMTVAGGLAMGMGIVASIAEPEQPSLAQRFHNQKVKTDAPDSNLPGMPGEYKSALNMAQQANTGFFADPNAAAAAQGEAVAESASDAPADETALGDVAGSAKGEGAAQSPEDLAAAFAGQKNTKAGMGSGKYGKLSSSMGGGGMRLAGGSGLSGGIGGNFKQSGLTNSKMGDLRAMSGANRAQVTRGKMSASNLGKSALKGATGKRLDKMNRAMGNAAAGSATEASATHAQQWDAAAPTGAGISGAGAGGISGGGQFSGDEGMGGGGPLDTNTSGGAGTQDVKDVGDTKNQTPYQNQLMMAQGLLMLASVIIMVVGICAMMEKTPFTAWIASIKMALYAAAIAMAAAAAAIGATIGSQYGQAGQGKIIAIGGTITAATAAVALAAPTMPSWILVVGGIAGLAASLSGMLKK